MNTAPLNFGSDKVPNRLARQKNPSKKCARILPLVRMLATGSSAATDTPSLVFVAVSPGLAGFATHSATDQHLASAESARNAKVAKGEGGGGQHHVGRIDRKSDSVQTKFSTNARLIVNSQKNRKVTPHGALRAGARNANPQ
jgi:hypothetical protein